jgi:hypothetical protein
MQQATADARPSLIGMNEWRVPGSGKQVLRVRDWVMTSSLRSDSVIKPPVAISDDAFDTVKRSWNERQDHLVFSRRFEGQLDWITGERLIAKPRVVGRVTDAEHGLKSQTQSTAMGLVNEHAADPAVLLLKYD